MDEKEFAEFVEMIRKFLSKEEGIKIPSEWIEYWVYFEKNESSLFIPVSDESLLTCLSPLSEEKVGLGNIEEKIAEVLLNSNFPSCFVDHERAVPWAKCISANMGKYLFENISGQTYYSCSDYISIIRNPISIYRLMDLVLNEKISLEEQRESLLFLLISFILQNESFRDSVKEFLLYQEESID